MLKVNVIDPTSGVSAKVDKEDGLHVHNDPYPPSNPSQAAIPLREFFVNSSASSDMAVNGSATAVEFSLTANNSPINGSERDKYIKQLHFLLADGTMSNDLFAGIGILTNGVKIEYLNPKVGTTTIVDAITTNAEFIRIARHYPFGSGATAYVLSEVTAAPTKDSAYLLVIDFEEQFGIPFGLRLPYGADAKLTITIQDDLTGASQFDCIAYGFERIIPDGR